MREDLKFEEFSPRGTNGAIIAVFRDLRLQEVAFDKRSLETRQRNLIAGGWTHEETDRVLAMWPDA